MILPRTKPKPPPKPYRTTWELTYDIFMKHAEIDEDKGRHTPILESQLRAMERELDKRDGL